MKSKFLEINYHYEDRINVNMSKEASYRLEWSARVLKRCIFS